MILERVITVRCSNLCLEPKIGQVFCLASLNLCCFLPRIMRPGRVVDAGSSRVCQLDKYLPYGNKDGGETHSAKFKVAPNRLDRGPGSFCDGKHLDQL